MQVDSSVMEELPLKRGARGLPQRLKTQAGKLRSRLQGLQRPTFSLPQRQKKPDKATRSATSSGKSDKSRTAEKRPSRMDRIRTSISERSARFSLPDRPKFNLPDRSKFRLPERPKFSFPDKSRIHLPDRSKFTIKKPSIRLREALARVKRPPSLREQKQQRSTESTAGSKRNIFDFATYPRIFDKKSKKHGEYATSSPKDSRAQSAESATFPYVRKRKSPGIGWVRPFEDTTHLQDQDRAATAASDRDPPWPQSTMEEPRLSPRTEEEIMAAASAIPWEDTRKQHYDEEEIQYMDYEQESSQEMSDRQLPPRRSHKTRRQEESYEHEEMMEVNPTMYDDDEAKHVHRIEVSEEEDAAVRNNWQPDQQMMFEEKFRPIPRSRSLDEDMPRLVEQGQYEGAFMAVDPRRFIQRKMTSGAEDVQEEEDREQQLEEDEEEHEPSSARSDREQQHSSSSSCVRRHRGIIEEIDSDEFFLRESGISQDDVNLGSYLTDEIRDALRSEIVSALQGDDGIPPIPPQRPARTRSLRKRKEDSLKFNETLPPVRPKRERAAAAVAAAVAARHSRETSIVTDEVFRERTRSDSRSDSRHRVVYQTEGEDERQPSQEPLDDIVVVKPARRKSKSSVRSQSQPPMETSIPFPETPTTVLFADMSTPFPSMPPIVPVRRKRSHRETIVDRRNGDLPISICNGHREWEMEIAFEKPVTPMRPSRTSRSRQSLVEQFVVESDIIMIVSASLEDINKMDLQLRQKDFTSEASAPIPPKRRSRSRTRSVVADEDRTSHGAESLPEAGYIEEDIPQDEMGSARDIFGYAIVEKREKPPRPPPPRRKRGKFATSPRPIPPKRPQRAYSTLGPATRSRSDADEADMIMSNVTIGETHPTSVEYTPYIEIDSDDGGEHKDVLRSDDVLNKIQGRPLPAPPRPPRARKEHAIIERPSTPFEFAIAEMTTATQTDPLPDDVVIEEEITQAKLTVTPSRSGSQVTVSMERIPSPSRTNTPPVPPLPSSQFLQKEEDRRDGGVQIAYDAASFTSPSPTREPANLEDTHLSISHLDRVVEEESRSRPFKSVPMSDEPLRIGSLEVGDLKVDRLSVSQIEAHKIVTSEVDAMMIAASEFRGGNLAEESLSPAIIKELMAIRSHLETVANSQMRERYREGEKEFTSREVTDIPMPDDDSLIPERRSSQQCPQDVAESDETESASKLMSTEDITEMQKLETDKDQKVVKTNVLDVLDVKDKQVSYTPSVAQAKESPTSQTLTIDRLESKGKDELTTTTTHLLTVAAQDTQDKSLQILDSIHPLTLSTRTTSDSHVDESRASFPPSSDSPTTRAYEHVGEPPCSSTQTTATEPTGTSTMGLRSSEDDVSDSKEQISRKSRSRSPSPARGIVRQTASPVRSLPPVISVTPDTPDPTSGRDIPTNAKPQRAVISYSSDSGHNVPSKDVVQPQRAVVSDSSDTGRPLVERQRESSRSPSFPPNTTHFIAFPASEIPVQFFSLSETPTNQPTDLEPSVRETTKQLLRALRSAGIRAMRYFVGYIASTLSTDDTREKVREVELAICALLLLIAGLLIYYFTGSRTVTHYHHWDYFNPPQ